MTAHKPDQHPRLSGFPPLVGDGARVLILGSMPGAASLAAGHYYAHPRNLFWPIMNVLFGLAPTLPYDGRVRDLVAAGVAVWDVLAHCRRPGSLDRAIVQDTVVPNDFAAFLTTHTRIRAIFFNGAEAERLFRRHVLPVLRHQPRPSLHRLPSTSPAHAGVSFAAKLAAWQAVRQTLQPLRESVHDHPPK